MFSLGTIIRMNKPPEPPRQPGQKRVKRVFTSRHELIGVFFEQKQEHGRTPERYFRKGGRGSAVFFNFDTLYSFGTHFPLCRLLNTPSGEQVAFLNTRHYSICTSQHQGEVRYALQRRKIPYFTCDDASHDAEQVMDAALERVNLDAQVCLAKRRQALDPYLEARASLKHAEDVAYRFELVPWGEFERTVTLHALLAKAEEHAGKATHRELNQVLIAFRKNGAKPGWRERRLAKQGIESFPNHGWIQELGREILELTKEYSY